MLAVEGIDKGCRERVVGIYFLKPPAGMAMHSAEVGEGSELRVEGNSLDERTRPQRARHLGGREV